MSRLPPITALTSAALLAALLPHASDARDISAGAAGAWDREPLVGFRLADPAWRAPVGAPLLALPAPMIPSLDTRPLSTFVEFDGAAAQERLDSLAAGLEVDAGDWRVRTRLKARGAQDTLEPSLAMESRWRLGRRWQVSGDLASRPLDRNLQVDTGRISLAARRRGDDGAWQEFRVLRRAAGSMWHETLELKAHRPLLKAPTERLSMTGRFARREAAGEPSRAFSLSLDHRWEAWAHADQRLEQRLSVSVGGEEESTDALVPVGRLRYAHLWQLGEGLDFEYSIERRRSSAHIEDPYATTLNVGLKGRF